jgi:hypothetical protein
MTRAPLMASRDCDNSPDSFCYICGEVLVNSRDTFLISNFRRVLYVVCFLLGDTFVIWPHGQEKLEDFLNHLNGLHNNIQFTTEKEQEGHLPFLDIDIYRKRDGSLGHKVYWKSTHTNLYLHQNSHHHPANKKSVLASLIHRAKALYDQDSLPQELEFLTTVFKNNGYSSQQIR